MPTRICVSLKAAGFNLLGAMSFEGVATATCSLDGWASTAKCYLSRFFVRSSAPWDDICELQGDVDGTFYIGPCTGVMTAATRA